MKATVRVNGVEVELVVEDPLPSFGGSLGPATTKWLDEASVASAESNARRDYDRRMGVQALHHQTVGDALDATWIIDRCTDRIVDKVVVEIGAGVGHLALELAKVAKHVFAIEVDCEFSRQFTAELYKTKPRNLTWIFGRAEDLVGILKADVAIVVTGSDEVYLRELAGKFASDIIMPWQDWNGGRARIAESSIRVDTAPERY